ncbi:MAG TPA: S41 family peptidase [Vicinamibacterales bacterium]|nr:S41 family peptidase [Vicinamibacterales bacterium]
MNRLPALLLAVGAAAALSAASAGNAVTPRAAYAQPAVSPDGSQIAFVSGGDIWTVPSKGGEARLLISNAANDDRPLYSPDGSRLAFVSTRTGGGDIHVLTFSTGDVTRITYDDGPDQLAAWSRDGKALYFYSSAHELSGGMNDVYRVSAEGGTPMPISADRYTNEFFADESPDGRWLALDAHGIASGQWWRHGRSHIDEAQIWLRDLHAPDVPASWHELTNPGAKDLWPIWDSSGKEIYFVSDRGGAENIWRVSPEAGSTPSQVTEFKDGRVLWPTVAAHGGTIAFERNFAIWTLDVASGTAVEVPITRLGAPAGPAVDHMALTSEFHDFALSPDGKKVAFTSRGEVFAASARDDGDAARVTTTAAAESGIAWTPDSRRIVYSSERDGDARLFVYDFTAGKERPLTVSPAVGAKGASSEGDRSATVSPDGKSVAYVRGGTELHVIDVDGSKDRILVHGVISDPIENGQPIAWSPDGKWLAYFTTGSREFTNVAVIAADGGDGKPISFLANGNATAITWSPDGTFLVFDTSQRTEPGQLARVELILRAPKFREDQFRDLFNEENAPGQPGRPASPAKTAPPAPPDVKTESPAASEGGASKPKPVQPVKIVFDGIRQRLSLLPTGLDVGRAFISPDGKTLVFIAEAADQQNLYSWSLDETSRERPVARQLTSTAGPKAAVCFTPDSKEIFYLDAGRIQSMALDKREAKPLSVTATLDVDFAAEKAAAFDEAYRLLRDNFFDPQFHGVDWSAERSRIEPYIAGARTPDEWRRIASLMIGELNASHMGIGAPPGQAGATGVGHIGLDFDREDYEKSGRLTIARVVTLGPAALTGAIQRGDRVKAVDGHPIDAHTNIDALLENTVGRRVVLTVERSGGSPESVPVRPITAAAERGLRYREWVNERRAYVLKVSGGKLGYVHMPDMSGASLAQLYVDLDAENIARDGVVIDIRNNNGGFVNAYALDIFSRQHYLNMTQRGQETAPARSVLGQRSLEKPTALVTNQHSLSDAEDFTEGYRAMKLGPVVGEPTAGWIIYTWNTQLLDGTVLRLPRVKITDRSGAPMELHPRPVDIPVERPLGESYGPDDVQLKRAVEALLARPNGS